MPTVSELQDVLDWRAVAVLRAIDEREGATVGELVDATSFERDRVADRCRQLETLGLIAVPEAAEGDVYELTGNGHGAVGAGLYDAYDLVGDADIDDLAERVADLLERRDDLREQVDALREDAEQLGERARRQFAGRDDVAEEFESLHTDIEELAAALSED